MNRKNAVAIEVKPFAWRDEGIDQFLDIVQEKGNVNTVFVNTYDSDPGRISKSGHVPCQAIADASLRSFRRR